MKTSAVAEARKRRAVELALWQERFDHERARLDLIPVSKFGKPEFGAGGEEQVDGRRAIGNSLLSNEAMQRIIVDHFVALERTDDRWLTRDAPSLSDEDRETAIENMECDRSAYLGDPRLQWDPGRELDDILAKRGIVLARGSKSYVQMCELLRRALAENISRKLERLKFGRFIANDPLLRLTMRRQSQTQSKEAGCVLANILTIS